MKPGSRLRGNDEKGYAVTMSDQPDQNSAAPTQTAAAGVRAILDSWGTLLAPVAEAWGVETDPKDKRFAAPEWQHPVFALMRQGYAVMADAMLKAAEDAPGLDEHQKAQTRFAVRALVDAMSPSNGLLTNPVILNKALDTGGQSVADGMTKLVADLQRGQLTQTDPDAFAVGRNLAMTPGQVVHRTPLYELIQYTPTTDKVLKTPLVIFPPWINRYYILDLTPEKSFIRWAVEQGITVFMVSWKSADATLKDTTWEDYIAAQIEAIDTIRAGLNVPAVHTIGYCVAGTTLAATLAVLAARGEAAKVASSTFFTAQVDFKAAGELNLFVDDAMLETIRGLSPEGYLDGRYMAATFNLLRGRDLIWNYVTNNYLMGEDYRAFDLLHWNGDVTNLPSKWHLDYLTDLYRDNKLVEPGTLTALGHKLDLRSVKTPSYVQAGKEDHIAPAKSVWEVTKYFQGPLKFVLAGSGHIAGVVNPPAAGKYQYWTNEATAGSLDEFIAGATEHKGSWWPDWIGWLRDRDGTEVAAKGARIPGKGKLNAIEPAPGSYVKAR
jgi:polyhydroxyalkanoate synthase